MKKQHVVWPQTLGAVSGLWQKILAGKGWTFVFLLWFGLLIAIVLVLTVHSRPLEQFESSAVRVRRLVEFWIDHGFWSHAGLSFSDTPAIEAHARVYTSYPPLYYYPLYFYNWVNHTFFGGPKFALLFHIFINQAFLWVSAASLGLLTMRVAQRFEGPPLLALACGIAGQAIYHTLPHNLEKVFELMPQQISSLGLIWFLICELAAHGRAPTRWLKIQALLVFVMVYSDKPTAVLGVALYLALKALLGLLRLDRAAYLIGAVLAGLGAHALQLAWMKLRFPDIIFIGSPFLWRSGLDGATNYVGVLTIDLLGANNAVLRNAGIGAVAVLMYAYLKLRQTELQAPLLLICTTVGFYVVPGYVLSQWAMIHPYNHDLFMVIAAILAVCAALIPYFEQKTGQTGLLVWLVILVAIGLCMYQLRVFAIKYPLPIPEPDWRANWMLG